MPSNFWVLYADKLAIVGFVLAALFFAARRLRQMRFFPRSGRLVNVIESTMLSQHAALHVITAGSRRFLIGSAAGGVTRIAELPVDESKR